MQAVPDYGKQANHFSRSGATLQKWVRRFAFRLRCRRSRRKGQVWADTEEMK